MMSPITSQTTRRIQVAFFRLYIMYAEVTIPIMGVKGTHGVTNARFTGVPRRRSTQIPAQTMMKASSVPIETISPNTLMGVRAPASATQMPSWFVIYSSFSIPPRQDITGLNLQFQLPHVVYLLPKHTGFKANELLVSANYDAKKQIVRCTVENLSGNFGRLLQLQAIGASIRQDASTGGIFPQSRRVFDIDWKSEEPPQRVVLQFKNLKIERPVASQE